MYKFLKRHERLKDVEIVDEAHQSNPLRRQDLSSSFLRLEKMDAPWQFFDSLFSAGPRVELHALQLPPLKDATLDFNCNMMYLWSTEEQLLTKLNMFSKTLRRLTLKRERLDIDIQAVVTTGKLLPWIEELELRHTYYNGRLSITEVSFATVYWSETEMTSI